MPTRPRGASAATTPAAARPKRAAGVEAASKLAASSGGGDERKGVVEKKGRENEPEAASPAPLPTPSPVPTAAALRALKKAKHDVDAAAEAIRTTPADVDVFITSSRACQAFAKRDEELSRLVKATGKRAGKEVTVYAHRDKKISSHPDVGSFVVYVKGRPHVRLEKLARPFAKLKELDLEEVAEQVAALL